MAEFAQPEDFGGLFYLTLKPQSGRTDAREPSVEFLNQKFDLSIDPVGCMTDWNAAKTFVSLTIKSPEVVFLGIVW